MPWMLLPTRSVIAGQIAPMWRTAILGLALIVVGLAWAGWHLTSLAEVLSGDGRRFAVTYAVTFGVLAWQTALAWAERPYRAPRGRQGELDRLRVSVIVPLYNEDPDVVRRVLWALLAQTRMPSRVIIVDDGSKLDYRELLSGFVRTARRAGVRARAIRTDNHGKRHAQAVGVLASRDADILVTVDSDSQLAPTALAEGLQPFADARVTAVAGLILGANHRRSVFTRLQELLWALGQLNERSTQSRLGCVLVNSGAFALYRAQVISRRLDAYLNETIAGRPMGFSDDSLLTLWAHLDGRTVQQPSAICASMLPERPRQYFKQQLRWARGSAIRSVWRLRYLPVGGAAYWLQLLRWTQTVVMLGVIASLLIYGPVSGEVEFTPGLVGWMIAVPLLVVYAQALRYLTVSRSDDSIVSQLLTVAAAPLALVVNSLLLRPLRWYAMATFLKTGWGTRAQVEVTIGRPGR